MVLKKTFFKLMNNSLFGKTMENIRNHVDTRLVNSTQNAKKLVATPNYEKEPYLMKNLVAVYIERTMIVFNKPIFVGMCVLDLSKILRHEFHCDYMISKYGRR